MPTPKAVRNSPNDAPGANRGLRLGARGRAVRPAGARRRDPPAVISRRNQATMSSPHEQPTVPTPSDVRNEMNDGQSEQCDRLTGVASIGHGSPTLRWRTATPRCDATRDGRS
jgi:hypothetical protein